MSQNTSYGEVDVRRVRSLGIRDPPISPRSPSQNGCADRLIGSIRRECLDHVGVTGERHLRHILLSYMEYYKARALICRYTRTRLSNGLSKRSDVSAHSQSSAGSTINMLGIDLRQGQPFVSNAETSDLDGALRKCKAWLQRCATRNRKI